MTSAALPSDRAEILDVCCGGRMWWWDKQHPLAVYMDRRVAPPGSSKRRPKWSCQPDLLADFTAIPFADEAFRLVVFDPPHLVRDTPSPASEVRLRYGELSSEDEHAVLRRGFAECWRVLAPGGTLVFKWWGPLERVACHFPTAPTVGTRGMRATKDQTWWLIFYKPLSGIAEAWRFQLDIYDEAVA